MPETRAQGGRRTWMPDELMVDGVNLVDSTGALRVPLIDAFWLPIFVSGARTFTLLPEEDHAPRVTIGDMVMRREGWTIPVTELPERRTLHEQEEGHRYAWRHDLPTGYSTE